jgi:hypothetical protein
MIPRYLYFLVFLLSTGVYSSATAQLKDYSAKAPDYSILKDIRLGATSIEHTGTHEISVEDMSSMVRLSKS